MQQKYLGKSKPLIHSILDFSTKHIELPTLVVNNDQESNQKDVVQVAVYNLPTSGEPNNIQLILNRQFDESKHMVVVKDHITKELNIAGESQILLQYLSKSNTYKAAPLPENVTMSSLLEKGDSCKRLILLLAVYQPDQSDENLEELDIAGLTGFPIRGYQTRHIIMMLDEFSLKLIRKKIKELTGLPYDQQLYYDSLNTNVSGNDLQEGQKSKDVFVATTNLEYEQSCIEWGVKIFKTFRLNFLTKSEELELGKCKRVKDLKNYLLETYQIGKYNQSLVFQGMQLEDSQYIVSLMVKEWEHLRDLTLNLFVIEGKFDVLVGPCWESDFKLGTNWFKVTVQDATTIAELKDMLAAHHLRVESQTFQLSLKGNKIIEEEFLPESKAIRECENIEGSRPLHFRFHPKFTYRVFTNETENGQLLEESEIMLDTEMTGMGLAELIVKKYNRTIGDIRPVPFGEAALCTSRFDDSDDINQCGLEDILWMKWEEGNCVKEFVIFEKSLILGIQKGKCALM